MNRNLCTFVLKRITFAKNRKQIKNEAGIIRIRNVGCSVDHGRLPATTGGMEIGMGG